jgi:hypothetical protein
MAQATGHFVMDCPTVNPAAWKIIAKISAHALALVDIKASG